MVLHALGEARLTSPQNGGSGPRRGRLWLLGVFALVAVGGVLGVVGVRLWARIAGSSDTEIRSTPSVISAVRDLARLDGAEFRIERVISFADKQSRLYGLIEAKDALLLVASGTVTAGVDLSSLQEGDVQVDRERRSAKFVLPSSNVVVARLDSEKTYVFERKTDLLATRKETLESEARQEAEHTLRSAAEEGGIVQRSNDNVRKTVETLVRSLGFSTVTVEFRGMGPGGDHK